MKNKYADTKMPCKKCRQCGHNSRTCIQNTQLEGEPNQPSTPTQTPNPIEVNDSMNHIQPEKGGVRGTVGSLSCYILGQTSHIRTGMGRTYNGYTVNLKRRLRQHNGEIKGGAFATKGVGPWEFIAVMKCADWTNVRAMKVEWLIRYPTRKKPRPSHFAGSQGRINSLAEVVKRMDETNIQLYVHPRFYDSVKLPPHVELHRTMEGWF
jgi:predicted GIY-YIG superfamily endonuclease